MDAYGYCYQNPVNLTDPSGMSPDWIKNGNGTYTAEKGDSAWTLHRDAGISFEEAKSLLNSQGKSNLMVGDVIVVNAVKIDGSGTITEKIGNAPTNVYQNSYKSNSYLGNLNTGVDVNNVFENLLVQNGKLADKIYNPLTFRTAIRGRGPWDFKNQQSTIFGYANKLMGDNAKFIFKNFTMAPQDIGNFHYGFVGKACGIFPETYLLQLAGAAQMSAGTSRPEWQIYEKINSTMSGAPTGYKILPPYGDDPRDQHWITKGINYYNKGNYGF